MTNTDHARPTPLGTLPRPVVVLLGLAALVVSVAGMRALGGTLGPTFLALVLVVTVHPVQAALRRRGVPAWLAVVAVLLLVYAVLLALAGALALSVARLATLLPTYGPELSDLLADITQRLEDYGVTQDQIDTAVGQLDLSNVVAILQEVLSRTTGVVSDLFFIVAMVLFLGVDSATFSRRLEAAAVLRPDLVAGLRSFAQGTRRYVAVSTAFGLVVAVFDVAALYWLAVPLPVLWGLLSFITNYVPNIGFVLGVVPPALLALLDGGLGPMVGVLVSYSVINVVIQSFIQPKVVGDAVGLSITLTFLSIVFWSFVFGPLGALLAIPASLLVKAVLVDADPASQWLRPLLGDPDPVPVPAPAPPPAP